MKITLIRHTQVIEKYQNKYNGHIDIPLSKEGILQAKEIAFQLQNEHFDKVYCSDLLRTRQTLEPFQNITDITFTKELREKSWGKHEGKSFEEITQEGIEYHNFLQWINALDGEDIKSFQKRIQNYFFHTIFQQKGKKNILVITHSGVIKTLLGIINNLSLEEAFSLQLDYGGITVIDI
ncbi:Alpha-ribazole-5'-phosphate phosphatase [hydrothermal vent metagenome]|uniref:Alpha-ribazole-5'-phosphate phosphatase n=1 Tax=hydrothermal vent metagenome TaxID=652676 RepID=A0A1W1D1P6_9ZZZZ